MGLTKGGDSSLFCCFFQLTLIIVTGIKLLDNSLVSNYNGCMNSNDIVSLISKIRDKVNKRLIAEMESHGIEAIVTSHGDILYALNQKSRMTMAEIASVIRKDKSTVTSLVEKLVKLGYVSKERDTEDTRVIYVTLTREGQELMPVFNRYPGSLWKFFMTGYQRRRRKSCFLF